MVHVNVASRPGKPPSTTIVLMASALFALSLIGCSALPPVLQGQRQWAVTVDNKSDRPATIYVGEDVNFGDPNWRSVGTVSPSVVAPRTKARVVITPPALGHWAVFVNPGPGRGPMLISQDAPPDFSGELPGIISIDGNGEPGFSAPGDMPPGWCDGAPRLGCP